MVCRRSAECAGSKVRSCLACCIVKWDLQREQGAFAWPVAMGGEVAVHFNGRQGAAVQAETMALFACGEAVGKDPRHVFGGDAFAFVLDADLQEAVLQCRD